MNNFYYTCVFGLRDLERKERGDLKGWVFLCFDSNFDEGGFGRKGFERI